jgi:N-methylhydantoinase B
MDNFTLEIVKDAIVAIGDEMFEAQRRTSMSPIVYETLDFAVGATDADGNLLAQGNGVTAFLATLDTAVVSTLERYEGGSKLEDGDVIITNTPYAGGGTHLSDVVIVLPVYHEGVRVAFMVNKAHWTEVGGMDPGSVSTRATDVIQEGLRFPFVKLYQRGVLNQALVDMIAANVRLPDSTLGDMHAGVAAARVGAVRLQALLARHGSSTVLAAMRGLLDYGERMTRANLSRLPQGSWEAEDLVESDGLGNGPFKLKVKVTLKDGEMIADFTGTSPQAAGPINTTMTGLVTGVRCAFMAVVGGDVPVNGGCFRMLRVICPPGTLLSAQSPAPTSIYYEALLGAIDVVWKALAPVAPHRLPAGHQRCVGATFISGKHADNGELFIMGEPLVGGWGAAVDRDGDNGQFCAGNGETFNIPVELAETRYGLRVERYGFHAEDGGAGEFRGGRGVVIDYRVVCDEAYLTVTYSGNVRKPWGVAGGRHGTNNYAQVIRADGATETHTMATGVRLYRGDLVRCVTGSGGGWGDPRMRSPARVAIDLRDGYITHEQAAAYR